MYLRSLNCTPLERDQILKEIPTCSNYVEIGFPTMITVFRIARSDPRLCCPPRVRANSPLIRM